MQKLAFLLLLTLLLASAPLAHAQGQQPHPTEAVAFEQYLGAQVPLDLNFLDETGATVRLGDYFDGQAVVLLLSYYECPMLCPLLRDGLVNSLNEVRLNVGDDFQVVNVSIDPTETPMNAASAKTLTTMRYNRPGTEHGWHFLTGTQDSIQQLANAVGFRYFYDETINQYAHASGILVLTPNGTLARYFYGIEFNPGDVRLGLVEASGNKIGTPVDQFLLLCYHFDPSTGRYTGLVMTIMRVAGISTVLIIGGAIFVMGRRSTRALPV
ncbi:MAG: SCO family protein [Candidatus Viridilinea halotolerans]|uniref:SCO family protein n=1 Tax=Candidatus Viridilinea halotolerans TaxID=2491704 RepID=A0A426TYR3_9CHLR|nr:MAG: SCO family protein [Candidatus Viridilinea halotolerans]